MAAQDRPPGVSVDAPPQLRLEMRSNPIYLSGAREMIAAVTRRLGFPDEACGQMALAVDEVNKMVREARGAPPHCLCPHTIQACASS